MTVLLYSVNMVVGTFITNESQLKSKPTSCTLKNVVRMRVSKHYSAKRSSGIPSCCLVDFTVKFKPTQCSLISSALVSNI